MFFLVYLVLPWWFIVRRWKEALGPNTFRSRLAVLILMSAGYRLTGLLAGTLAEAFGSVLLIVLQAIQVLFYLIAVVTFVFVSWIVIANPRDCATVIKNLVKPPKGRGKRASFWGRLTNALTRKRTTGTPGAAKVVAEIGKSSLGNDREPIVVDPSRDLARSLLRKYGPVLNVPTFTSSSDTERRRMLMAVSIFLILIIAAFAISGPGAGAGIAGLGTLLLVLYCLFILPVETARRMRNGMREAAIRGLNLDVEKYFKAILAQIMDDDSPQYARMTLVSVLDMVPFNVERYQLLCDVYETLPDGPLRMRMTDVVASAYHQVRMDSEL